MYCLNCRKPRTPALGMVDYEPFTPSRGTLVGMCPECKSLMRRLASRSQLEVLGQAFTITVRQPQETLEDTATPNPNCHLSGET